MEKQRRLRGGLVYNWSAAMAGISLTQAHVDAIRSGEMCDSWYDEVADQCWRAAKPREVERLKASLRAFAYMQPLVVDRRPSRLKMIKEAT